MPEGKVSMIAGFHGTLPPGMSPGRSPVFPGLEWVVKPASGGTCALATTPDTPLIRWVASGTTTWTQLGGDAGKPISGTGESWRGHGHPACRMTVSGAGQNAFIQVDGDVFGRIPVFYCAYPGGTAFATHLRGLKKMLGGAFPAWDADSLLHYHHFGTSPPGKSLFTGICRLEPGCRLEIRGGGTRITRRFAVADLYDPGQFFGMDVRAAADDLRGRVERAIAERVWGAGRAAVALSGGLDSGLITTVLSQLGIGVQAYNLVFDGAYTEADRLRYLQNRYGIDLEILSLNENDIIKGVESVNALSSEPRTPNESLHHLLGRRARQDGFSSLWDGDGVDRLFWGMNRQNQLRRLHSLLPLLAWMRADILLDHLPGIRGRGEVRKMILLIHNYRRGIPPYAERSLGRGFVEDPEYENQAYTQWVAPVWEDMRKLNPRVDWHLFVTLFSLRLCPYLFFHPAWDSLAPMGLMPVSPFWDKAVVSAALSMPLQWKVRGKYTKYILRRAAQSADDSPHWWLPKVCLFNAELYLQRSDRGREWLHNLDYATAKSEAAQILAGQVPGISVTPASLRYLELWRRRWMNEA